MGSWATAKGPLSESGRFPLCSTCAGQHTQQAMGRESPAGLRPSSALVSCTRPEDLPTEPHHIPRRATRARWTASRRAQDIHTQRIPKNLQHFPSLSQYYTASSPRRLRGLVPRRVRAVEETRAVAYAVPEATVELGKAVHVLLVERQRGADEVLHDPARLHALRQASEAAPHAPRDQHLRGK